MAVHLVAQGSSGDAKVEESKDADGDASVGTVSEAVVIDNVRAFKAMLPLSEGARPVKDLVEFEDLEPKL